MKILKNNKHLSFLIDSPKKSEQAVQTHLNGSQTVQEISHKNLIKEKKENETLILNLTSDVNEGISPKSKINGTSITLNDIIKHGDKISIGEHIFTKKCKHSNKCFVSKCPYD